MEPSKIGKTQRTMTTRNCNVRDGVHGALKRLHIQWKEEIGYEETSISVRVVQ
jgi:hypothetical protein